MLLALFVLTITTAATTNRSVASERRASSRTLSSPAAAEATANVRPTE